MNIKTLAIAAAAVMTAGAAQAADLGKPVKAAVDYVKICDAYGAGFFYIPGSDTCLQISGYARASFLAGSSTSIVRGATSPLGFSSSNRASSTWGTATEIELDFDARTNTDFGLLRSYISIEADFNSVVGNKNIDMNRGYIQWGGLTAGNTETFFTHYTGDADGLAYGEVAPDYHTNVLAYTFAFGNGVTATLSVEDSTIGNRNNGPTFTTTLNGVTTTNAAGIYGGNHTPDVVAQLAVTQAWGSAQLSAGIHESYNNGTPVNGTKEGYGVLGYVGFNLPSIGAGDKIDIQASWSRGALSWVNSQFWNAGFAGDAVVFANGTVKQSDAWGVGVGFVHNFSSTVFVELEGGVSGVTGYGWSPNGNGIVKNDTFTQYDAALSLGWKPVKGLTLTGDVEYRGVDFSSTTKNDSPILSKDASAWIVGVRVLRNF
ncbi:MAG: porin [Ancalomicrobiaceae bacterium]|nr:porin [Ancalomicrobiaceae bacterium]